ncbi:hypothetical protein [Marinicella litoralis]|uniref:Uncharacterized protein n=1 Tax=Marinicella litoralis TaxID=644220 RepID=A0A4R6XWP6_9GAMM|nr:hypothetical protein [Marinicella litoralis]TDR22674.1 hypothetical protein C8D91_1167 [Marinicella litoralis]
MKITSLLIFVLFLTLDFQVQASGNVDFTPHGTQPGLSFPLSSSADCAGCHKGGGVTDDEINMPYSTWVGSMKANAGRDPLFWAALDVANNDQPGVGDWCLKCHAPMGWYKGNVVKPAVDGAPLIDGANGCELDAGFDTGYTSEHSNSNDFGGVSCHFCHRVDELGPANEPQIIENGSVWLDDEVCSVGGGEPCRKGPYDAIDYDDGGTPALHAWEYSSFLQSSEFCGSCHNVSSPTIQNGGSMEVSQKLWDNGIETNLAMPIERTYAEWKNSYFADLIYRDGLDDNFDGDFPIITQGETCQGCHMPQSDSINARACDYDVAGRRQDNLRTHQFAGGNTWIPQVLKALYGDELEANDTGRKDAFDLTTSYAYNMLQNQSALIEPEVVSVTDDLLTLDVKVTNKTGHKLPTGYPEGRRMWLHVVAKDVSNQVIWESGAYDVATGVLTENPPVKIYESLQGIWDPDANGVGNGACEVTEDDGDKMFHFALNNCIVKDNRIPPLGFRGATDIELKSVPVSYPLHPNNTGQVVNYDVSNYQIPLTGMTGPFTVEATLKYQIASKEYIEFLEREATEGMFETENQMCNRSWTEGPADQSRGAFMKTLWESYGRSEPVDMVMTFIDNIVPQ